MASVEPVHVFVPIDVSALWNECEWIWSAMLGVRHLRDLSCVLPALEQVEVMRMIENESYTFTP